jgi:hypothetical protein
MRMFRGVVALVAGAIVAAVAPGVAAAACDPFGPAEFAGTVPTPKQVIGIDLGDRDVTTAESDAYVTAVDAASDRVVSAALAKTVTGRYLQYAIVGNPDRVTEGGLAGVRAAAAKLMDPKTSAAEAQAIAASDPAILWIAGNVHGGEESGADAALRVLWELSDRQDCSAQQILDNAIVVILPIQNPDGREADTRRNSYGFDLNRDWFARTQQETEGKLEYLRRYPPQVFIDAHEMGGENNFFFPPNADPVYHEITDQSIGWINGLYGPAMQDVFDARGIPYFNYDVYDLFYMGYGDTVPSTGFGAAGMTYEKSNLDSASQRVFEQYLTQWTTLSTAALNKASILNDWHAAWVEAVRQGRAGELEPNEVVQPDNTVQREVPDIKVRQYFLLDVDPYKRDAVRALVRRLQRMDVEVNRLTHVARVRDYTPYGRATRRAVLPTGTYVVSMAQRQKHWIQAMLNEDTYTPFPYFYDVTAWSQPLLFNVPGGYSGRRVALRTAPVSDIPLGQPPVAHDPPTVGLYSMSPDFSRGIESSGWLRWLLDKWGIHYRELSAADIAAGGLADVKVLLVPDGYATQDPEAPAAPYGLGDLGPAGQAAIRAWVENGGRYVGWLDGAVLAAAVGASSATFSPAADAGISSPGALVRARVNPRTPLTHAVGRYTYPFFDARYVMDANGAPAPVRYPRAGRPAFFVSGYAEGAEALGGTPAVVDERVGDGRTVSFAFEPNFRAFTNGTQILLRNAILGSDPAASATPLSARVAARRDVRDLSVAGGVADLVVVARGEDAAARVLRAHGLRFRVRHAAGRAAFAIAGDRRLSGDEIGWARDVESGLRAARVPVVMYRVD